MRLYDDLTDVYALVTPPEEYADEAAAYGAAIERHARRSVKTMLDLGGGAGHNVSHLKVHYACVVSDISPRMLELSRRLNPECETAVGDMRTLRLGRTFDAVLVHDAVQYMTTLEDLEKAMATAFVHLEPGGVAVFAPDALKETLVPATDHGGSDQGERGTRYLEWTYDPDPNDTTYIVDYAFLIREGNDVRVVHDRHIEGVFPRTTWIDALTRAGFEVQTSSRPNGDAADQRFTSEVFVGIKPT